MLQSLADSDGIEFQDIEAALTELSEATLSEALDELESADLIDRVEVSKHPPQIEYVVTEKGAGLATICGELAEWCETHAEEAAADNVEASKEQTAAVEQDTAAEQVDSEAGADQARATDETGVTTPDATEPAAVTAADTEQPVVLLVDDNPDMTTMQKKWLHDEFSVRTAHSGEAAIETLDSSIDIAVLDRVMPEISGDTVLEVIRAEEYDMRVVMVTGEPPTEELLEMPFDEYLTKPVEREVFLETISELLERSEYDEDVQEFLARKSKAEVIQTGDEETE